MSRRARIFLALVLAYMVGMVWLIYDQAMGLDWRYRESAEESLVETAQLAASVIEQDVEQGALPADRIAAIFRDLQGRPFSAQVFGLHKTQVELRAYVTNRHGIVVYDSQGRALGQNFLRWRDVSRTLAGQYGARTTRDVPTDPTTSVMYVAAPIRWQGDIVGVVTLGKPVRSFAPLLASARWNMLYAGLMFALALLGAGLLLAVWLTRPLGLTRDVLAALSAGFSRDAQGRRRYSPRRAWRAFRAHMHSLMSEIREAIAGRNYIASYVQQLTHEIKSPLSAIRGAAELLQEANLPAPARQQFAASIAHETLRMQEVIDRMLELSTLENRRLLQNRQRVPLPPLLQEMTASARAKASHLSLALRSAPEAAALATEGDAFLLRRAIGNLLDNAIDFSPAPPGRDSGSAPASPAAITITLRRQGRMAVITIRDHGPGLPAYAQARVFDKFFSLPRPATQKKSTGLGLAFVREIATLHQGSITLRNAESGGAIATLRLPAEKA